MSIFQQVHISLKLLTDRGNLIQEIRDRGQYSNIPGLNKRVILLKKEATSDSVPVAV